MNDGVTGYVNHTVPIALFCWLRWPQDFRRSVEEVIRLGGDTDTTGAITGALAGATVGESGIPTELLSGILEWRYSIPWMRELANELEQRLSGGSAKPLRSPWLLSLLHNPLFAAVVLIHGFRRLFPPY